MTDAQYHAFMQQISDAATPAALDSIAAELRTKYPFDRDTRSIGESLATKKFAVLQQKSGQPR